MRLSTQQFSEVVTEFRLRETSGVGSEKRAVTRIGVQAPIDAALFDTTCGRRFTVLTRDISMDGAGLMASMALKSGQKLVTRLPRGHGQWLFVISHVMHCRPLADGIFVLGCRFADLLTKEQAASLQDQGEQEMQRVQQSILG